MGLTDLFQDAISKHCDSGKKLKYGAAENAFIRRPPAPTDTLMKNKTIERPPEPPAKTTSSVG